MLKVDLQQRQRTLGNGRTDNGNSGRNKLRYLLTSLFGALAFVAANIDGGGCIEVLLARLDRLIFIGGSLDRFGVQLHRLTAFLATTDAGRARAFYERHGYRQVGEFHDYVIDGASEILVATADGSLVCVG